MVIITHKWRNLEDHEFLSYRVPLSNVEAKRLTRKLSEQYNIQAPILKFNKKRNIKRTASANYKEFIVRLPHNPDAELVCHEIAHLIVKKGHCKTWYETLKELLIYASKKNYWKTIEKIG